GADGEVRRDRLAGSGDARVRGWRRAPPVVGEPAGERLTIADARPIGNHGVARPERVTTDRPWRREARLRALERAVTEAEHPAVVGQDAVTAAALRRDDAPNRGLRPGRDVAPVWGTAERVHLADVVHDPVPVALGPGRDSDRRRACGQKAR